MSVNKRERAMLERAYSAEVSAALNKTEVHLMQTKSELAEKLVEDGFLRKQSIRMHGPRPCTVDGYELTEVGRLAYCLCKAKVSNECRKERNDEIAKRALCGEKFSDLAKEFGVSAPRIRQIVACVCKRQNRRWFEAMPTYTASDANNAWGFDLQWARDHRCVFFDDA